MHTKTVSDLAATRYGRRPGLSKRSWWLIAISIVLVLAAGIAWYVFSRTYNNISFDTVGFEATNSQQATVRGQITTTNGAAARCSVQAFDKNFNIAGWKYVDLPKSANNMRTISVQMRTISTAVTGNLNSCWLVN